jgi:tellurium resistance protein TerD
MSDTINLTKGANVNLSKVAPGAGRFVVGLGWNPNPANAPDLDAAAYPCTVGPNGEPTLLTPAGSSFVFFGNLKSADGAIVHSGDNLTGDGDGDDERITIDTSKLDSRVSEIIIGVAIFEGAKRNQTFGLVRNAYVRVYDAAALEAAEAAKPNMSDAELKALAIAHYDLEEDAGQYTAFQFGTFYQKDSDWRFKALGVGAAGDLGTFVELLAPGAAVQRA